MPKDTTPDPRDMQRAPDAQRIPEAERPDACAGKAPDIRRRPPLPDEPLVTDKAVDADPTRAEPDRGPGVGAGVGAPDGELNRG